MNRTIIYGLIDPCTKQLRYVGKTQRSLNERMKEHRHVAQGGRRALNQWCARWLRSLYAAGVRPDVEIFETISNGADWIEAEKFWIAYWKFLGANLTNHTDGGDGLAGMKRPLDVIARGVEKRRGRVLSAEARHRMREAWTPERRAANGARLRGITMSDEARKKMSVSGRKRFRSQAERDSCRERLRKLNESLTPEQLHAQKLAAGLKGGRPKKVILA